MPHFLARAGNSVWLSSSPKKESKTTLYVSSVTSLGLLRYSCVVGTSSGRTTGAERRSGAAVGWERGKNGVKGLSTACGERGRYGRRSGRRKGVGSARSRERSRAEAGSTAQRSQMLRYSTLGIKDLGPRTKEGLDQAGEAMAGGRIGELELLSVSS
jgi:hypothetical protein